MPMTTNFAKARLLLSPHTTVLFPNSYIRVSDVLAVLAVSDVLALITYSLLPTPYSPMRPSRLLKFGFVGGGFCPQRDFF